MLERCGRGEGEGAKRVGIPKKEMGRMVGEKVVECRGAAR